MGDLSDLDMRDVQAESVRQALPPGDYQALVIEVQMKSPKAGGAPMLELVLQVQRDPQHPQFANAQTVGSAELATRQPGRCKQSEATTEGDYGRCGSC
jgi:hypothetical protein